MISLSVIIPVYNGATVILACINSVLNELLTITNNYEIIIINDGSTDNTLSLIKEIACFNRQIIIIDQKNQGAAIARNNGLLIARGDIIAFNDADDIWIPGRLTEQLAVLERYSDIDCLVGNHDVDKQKLFGLKKIDTDLYKIDLKNQLFKNYFSPPNAIIKKKVRDAGIIFNPVTQYMEDEYFGNHLSSRFIFYFKNKKYSESILHKARYGETGLSGNLKAMERGELYNLKDAYKNLGVSFRLYLCAVLWSYIKYFYRIIKVKLKL
jgi:glycosyltransferase involved in cell wall biosynthesis